MPITVRGMVPLIQVFDMPASLRFYCEQLGFTLVTSAGPAGDMGWAWLRLGDAELMLNTQYELPDRPPAPDAARKAAHGDTGLYFGCPDVQAAYEHMRAAGLAVKPPGVTGYGYDCVEVVDPDGYHLFFQSPKKMQ